MPLILEANYSKKIGLPGYSSHQFMVTLRTEITDLAAVPAESDRLHGLLQAAVDTSLQKVGYLPEPAPKSNGNGHDRWQCSDKQKSLILKIVEEHQLDKASIEQLAQERFGKGVRTLNKLEASGLIEELFEQHGGGNGQRRFNRQPAARP